MTELTVATGAFGLPAYTFKGIYEQIQKKRGFDVEEYFVAMMLAQGDEELKMCILEEEKIVRERWEQLMTDRHGKSKVR